MDSISIWEYYFIGGGAGFLWDFFLWFYYKQTLPSEMYEICSLCVFISLPNLVEQGLWSLQNFCRSLLGSILSMSL